MSWDFQNIVMSGYVVHGTLANSMEITPTELYHEIVLFCLYPGRRGSNFAYRMDPFPTTNKAIVERNYLARPETIKFIEQCPLKLQDRVCN